ncbi:MAG: hypothetical protein Q4D98_06880, partial [Planctomycetia bacterium]|nr:hypothetical protein [Planctomycetia bacterium]
MRTDAYRWLLCLVLALGFAGTVFSQDDEEEPVDAATEEVEEEVSLPTKGKRDLFEENIYGDFVDSEEGKQFGDEGVNAILAMKPQTVPELVKAAKLIADLGRFEIADQLYERVMKQEPTDAQIYELSLDYGQNFFFTLSQDDRMPKFGKAFGKYALESLEKYYADPETIRALIRQLSDPEESQRQLALQELRTRSGVAIPAMIQALSDPALRKERAKIEEALLVFGEITTDAAIAALDGGPEAMRLACLRVLAMQAAAGRHQALTAIYRAYTFPGGTNDKGEKEPSAVALSAARFLESLTRRKPLPEDVGTFLQRELTDVLREKGQLLLLGNDTALEVLWDWDAEEERVVSRTGSPLEAASSQAWRLATALWNLYPNDFTIRRQYLRATFEQIVATVGATSEVVLGSVAFQEIQENDFTAAEVESLLAESLEKKDAMAGIVAAIYLGETGEKELLQPRSSRIPGSSLDSGMPGMPLDAYSPLVSALDASDRALRFAALEAVMKLNPQTAFPGSSRVMDALSWFLRTESRAKVLVANKVADDATLLGGRFARLGYGYHVAVTPKQMLQEAQSSCDYEMVLIHMNILEQVPEFILQQFQQDARLADLPIVLLPLSGDFKKAERLADKTPKCVWYPYPFTDESLGLLQTLAGRVLSSARVPEELRKAQTHQCLKWAAEIARTHQGGWIEDRREPKKQPKEQ